MKESSEGPRLSLNTIDLASEAESGGRFAFKPASTFATSSMAMVLLLTSCLAASTSVFGLVTTLLSESKLQSA